ncbi:hypothetical protein [Pontibacillus marinus]|uniref:Uncharacterized protein n=1 Tax=Pontibacillus marinus BH030004 = DSM 16465 TaxID=1385511 RepID=A0A0A5G208_9BACI|nr:hypothetical protein [Pontibacillus marinus]KGX85105.1 hypothetical protein N783_15320 [Pontibacillus marinus BH030004 = DSM 16465]
MKRVIDALREKEVMERLPVVRMEIDYELMMLHEAMKNEDEDQKVQSKERLEKLRNELLQLNVS